MEHLVSQISLHSRFGPHSSFRGKNSPSTNQTSKAQQHDSTLGVDSQDDVSLHQTEKIKQIQKKISHIESCQSQLQSKFEKVIDSLLKEISKKDEMNAQLQNQIKELSVELSQSKKDLNIIVNYLNKKKLKTLENSNRKATLNTTKASGKLQKSVSGSKGTIDLSTKEIRQDKKNRSPRTQLLKKSYKC